MSRNPKKVLILGSGGLRIGQAGEFDYSGSQAIKALKEEGIFTVLINPNIATVQTDADMADRVYFQPLNITTVTKIIEREKPDGILLSFGGQTALNLGLELNKIGIFKKFGVRVLGTPVETIKITEDRDLFKKALTKINILSPKSFAVYTVEEALRAASAIGYPVMMRAGYSLGGLGSGKIENKKQLKEKVHEAFQAVSQILIEEYLGGWKEIEYEVVRDKDNNTITVCNMENMDPMGIHTGESIVVAPSQTLTNEEYHSLRAVSIKIIQHLGVIGECNVQFALNSVTGEYRVIEVNARLSRSSALASKVTGYPLAFIATKLALGYKLHELKNSVTGTTSAFFEPALDYLAVKIPRWDLTKFKSSEHTIGSEMKSVGEVMALGRSFPEALQKAVRMLNVGCHGLTHHPFIFNNPLVEIGRATDRRLFAIYEVFRRGGTVEKVHKLSKIDPWFLWHIKHIQEFETRLRKTTLVKEQMLEAKKFGFSDKTIGHLKNLSENVVRRRRIALGVVPIVKQIDTLAGEFDAETNYLYTTYHGVKHDVEPLVKTPVIILGSGPYCIGSSVEFDWCAVNTTKTLRQCGKQMIMINSNPETVSTDFDCSDRLYFEELTLERIRDIADFEALNDGIMVSVGGQIANNMALPLAKAGYRLLGTSADAIDRAENRQKFSSMLHTLGVDQPEWEKVTNLAGAKRFAQKVGYPVLIRPSYILSGGAMNVVTNERDLQRYLGEAARLSPDHPVVISRFIMNAKELEIDGVADRGNIVIYAISEHIENAGVHSGDATIVLPPQRLYLETIRRAKNIARQIASALAITGSFNIQFIAKDNEIKVIECNLRASRSFPFVSKVTNHNFIEIATQAVLGIHQPVRYNTIDLDHVGVKSPQFSYNRLKGADSVAGVEMASTGEVACLGDNLLEAFYLSWLATEQSVKGKRLFLSIADDHKHKFIDEVRALHDRGWRIYTTKGTYAYFNEQGILLKRLHCIDNLKDLTVENMIKAGKIDLVVNIPSPHNNNDDARKIRRLAIDHHIPLVTNAETGTLLLRCLAEIDIKGFQPKSLQDFIQRAMLS
ncbi:carbamoyl phosphate synthase large subunit [Candidatus Nomurabacteria bacterium RIFCSPLOWO2_02_FULL_42_17]|uniref:Carbamoyl phosphate synthase large subunit n=2 Tax=Candidatus Nomuraibacteriota TaxID=1752729 RepID=A0A1F6WGM9_9BACT|nr:MAG: carbamoyl phosphate synthase large subunit [Candidatus Nomurabacteria bacterium RIFCSPHIGHO2_02_FULL_42_24]OGI96890.1 MAG: carbamoyl phosphate synthase large subunit [Candidatus Nomurabacteria bacterium RIFCSPLOWO2_02_FULL_42_17]